MHSLSMKLGEGIIMDTNKFYEFFQPEKCKHRVHIIGCGAVGSTIAELLTRMGITKFTLYDFDIVEPHNIANQMFRHIDIGKKKTDALAEMMRDINPEVDITIEDKYENQMLNGYVFLAVDKVGVRKDICQKAQGNLNVKAIFDVRIRLTDAQAYAARWDNYSEIKDLLNSMNFTDEEAEAETPVSACNMTISVAPTVRMICNLQVVNFINLLKAPDQFKKVFLIDAFEHHIDKF